MDLARNLIQRINVGDSLTRSAAARPDRLAVVDGPRRWTYAELHRDVHRAAQHLLRGYRPGERVAIWAPNSPEWQILQLGAADAGLRTRRDA